MSSTQIETIENRNLLGLINTLNALASNELWDVSQIERLLYHFDLKGSDVEEFVHPNSRQYHRQTIFKNEKFEVLIMTWLPGQKSRPHDHANSLCAVKVLRGSAIEDQFEIAPDGFVERVDSTELAQEEIIVSKDASVHALRNSASSDSPLVTLHVYCPPLGNFRCFEERRSTEDVPQIKIGPTPKHTNVLVIGGGFSGSIVAANLLNRSRDFKGDKLTVTVAERRGTIGTGVAYGTPTEEHLLNVPANRMSAWPDRPDDFSTWAFNNKGSSDPKGFLPRKWYGEYIRETLLRVANERYENARLSLVLDEVVRVQRDPNGTWDVQFASGQSQTADALVLAIGHRPPSDPFAGIWLGPRTRYIADPWNAGSLQGIGSRDTVIALGSGLTAIDVVLSLFTESDVHSVTLLSRRGLLPKVHAGTPPRDMSDVLMPLLAKSESLRLIDIVRTIRKTIKAQPKTKDGWQSVIDGVRPFTSAIWQTLNDLERQKFLSRLRPYWEVHRHRMPPEVNRRLNDWLLKGQLRLIAADVNLVTANHHAVEISLNRKLGSIRNERITADWVINCTGPQPSNSATANPVIASLIGTGIVRSDSLNLGLLTADDGRPLDSERRAVENLWILGTLRKPQYWESTAVPELREQAAQVCNVIYQFLKNHQTQTSG
jgi:uncharacterized NAD(P)/FAD-binding protein YdhS/predicted metal-dependent enzyme (double-stranded beta helix superfamily)